MDGTFVVTSPLIVALHSRRFTLQSPSPRYLCARRLPRPGRGVGAYPNLLQALASSLPSSSQRSDFQIGSLHPGWVCGRFRRSDAHVPSPLESTLTQPPTTVDSKPLTTTLSPLSATLTKNIGGWGHYG